MATKGELMLSAIDEPSTIVMRWWVCQRCGRKLGKIIGQTVIIQPRPDRVITIPISSGVISTCKCGHNNTPPRD